MDRPHSRQMTEGELFGFLGREGKTSYFEFSINYYLKSILAAGETAGKL